MDPRKLNLLITGTPGVGKTTLIRKMAEKLAALEPVGFYTSEIRVRGVRTGFELVGLNGRRGLLSHMDIKGHHRIGKYGVDVAGFERFLDAFPFLDSSTKWIILDEIGKMECLSEKFNRLLREILDSEKRVIATIGLRGTGLIAEIKARKDVKLFEITLKNRETLISEILKEIGTAS